MALIFSTATLRQLALRHRLTARELVPGADREQVATFLHKILRAPDGINAAECLAEWLAPLEASFVIAHAESAPQQPPGLPFAFVEAINFELTYGCNLACPHCLQDGLRPDGRMTWIDTQAVTRALDDGTWLGLTKGGVNFTGGEIYMPGSPVLDLITHAARAGMQIRSNTNAWWGGRTGFTIGEVTFGSDEELVGHLQSLGLTILAMSLDDRYTQYPDLLERVVRVASLCEEVGMHYECVATSASDKLVENAMAKLAERIDGYPSDLIPTTMETVDIGAAAGEPGELLRSDLLASRTLGTDCHGSGFHRPHFLHVNPTGGVRPCMYAPGVEVLGNITRERLPEILNRADSNPVARLFADGSLEEFAAEWIAPWRGLYRDVKHPCAASALIVRVAAAVAGQRDRSGRDPDDGEMEWIHRTIAREWNLGFQ